MFIRGNDNWRPPLLRIGRLSIHLAGLVVLLEILGMLVVVVGGARVFGLVIFEPQLFLGGRLWTAVTYAFFSPPSILWAVGLYFFYQFGTAVEQAIGRPSFFRLLLWLLFLPPLISLACSFANLDGAPLFGTHVASLSVFLAFCAMYPNVPSFFGIRIKWFGLVFLAVALLQVLMVRDVPMIISFGVCAWLALFWVRRHGFTESFGLGEELLGPGRQLGFPARKKGRKKKTKKAIRYEPKMKPRSKVSADDSSEVDRLLDKISREGLQSLTEEERNLLRRAAGK